MLIPQTDEGHDVCYLNDYENGQTKAAAAEKKSKEADDGEDEHRAGDPEKLLVLSELGGRIGRAELILRPKGEVDDANNAPDQDFADGYQGNEDHENPPLLFRGQGVPILAREGRLVCFG